MKKIGVIIAIILMTIGFAAISTTLVFNGTIAIGNYSEDLKVYFSRALVNEVEKNSVIIDDTHIVLSTEFKEYNQEYVLEYDVTNGSTQYDVIPHITISNYNNEYLSITNTFEETVLTAKESRRGKITIKLIKVYGDQPYQESIMVTLDGRAVGRTSIVEDDSLYQIAGILKDKDGNTLKNQKAVVFGNEPKYVETDDQGFFYVNGLETGRYEVYVVNEDVTNKTKEEIQSLATDKGVTTSTSETVEFSNLKMDEARVELQRSGNATVTLDADGGTISSNSIVVPLYSRISELPTPTRASNYHFEGWYNGDKLITNNTIIHSNMTLKAKWTSTCEYAPGKVWNFDYTGGEQEFIVPDGCDGIYKLETWGASGTSESGYNNYGYGGYSTGLLSLKSNNSINVVVGARSLSAQGGYNGGGNGGTCGSHICYGGGGATHIALDRGELSNLENKKNSVLIVSGAGGSSWGYTVYGGNAGGYIGLNAKGQASGIGGNQLTAGSTGYCNNAGFGKGGSTCVVHSSGCNCASGGGSGWYGGSVGYVGTTASGAGGGGSSYIGNPLLTDKEMYCYNCTPSDGQPNEEQIKTISNTCVDSSPKEKCSKIGNGYARITLVSYE